MTNPDDIMDDKQEKEQKRREESEQHYRQVKEKIDKLVAEANQLESELFNLFESDDLTEIAAEKIETNTHSKILPENSESSDTQSQLVPPKEKLKEARERRRQKHNRRQESIKEDKTANESELTTIMNEFKELEEDKAAQEIRPTEKQEQPKDSRILEDEGHNDDLVDAYLTTLLETGLSPRTKKQPIISTDDQSKENKPSNRERKPLKLAIMAAQGLEQSRKKLEEQQQAKEQEEERQKKLDARQKQKTELLIKQLKERQKKQEEQQKIIEQEKEAQEVADKERKKQLAEEKRKKYNDWLISQQQTTKSTIFNLPIPTKKTLGPIIKTGQNTIRNFPPMWRTRAQTPNRYLEPSPVSKISLLARPRKPTLPDLTPPTPLDSPTSSIKPMPSPEPPVPIYVHSKIITLMEKFGYPQEHVHRGVCLGIASMASQAALLGEEGITTFNNRIHKINEQYDELINKINQYLEIQNKLQKLEEKQQKIRKATYMPPPQKEKLLRNIELQIKPLKQTREELTEVLDLRAFFDGIYTYQNTLFTTAVSGLPQLTKMTETFNIVKPFAYRYEKTTETSNIAPKLLYNPNQTLQRANTPFLGCFTKSELTAFLQDFNEHLQKLLNSAKNQSIVFHIHNINHDTAIIYDQEMNKYFFVDANFTNPDMLIPVDPTNMPELANHIFRSLADDQDDSSIAISINTYLTNNSQLPIEQITNLENTTKKKEWSAALTRNDSTATNSTLLDLTMMYKDPKLVETLVKSFDQTTKNKKLIRAVYAKEIDLIQTLLLNGADINCLINGDTILMHALYLNNSNIIKCLLTTTKNNPNITEKILYYIIREERHKDILQTLLKQNYLDQNQKNQALLYAIYSNNIEAIELLLSNGADINFKSENDTILSHAISLNNPQVIAKLIKHQKPITVVDEKMLSYAIDTKNLKLLQYLLSQHLDKTTINNALIRAIYANNSEITAMLLSKGADINHEIHQDTILTHAISLKNPDIIACLLQHTQHTPIVHTNTLSHALSSKNQNLINHLLTSGKFINQETKKQALIYAIAAKDINAIRILLTNQPDLHFNVDQATFRAAIDSNNDDIIQLLVEHGNLDSNTKNNTLMQMVDANKISIVTALLRQGANIEAKDQNGYTILTHALFLQYSDMVNVLLKHNPTIDENALNYAIAWGDKKIITKLLKNTDLDTKIVYDALIYEMLYSQRTPIIHLLLQFLNKKKAFDENNSLLTYAIHTGNVDIINITLKYNKIVDQTALSYAIEKNNIEIISLLLQKGQLVDEAAINTALAHMVYLGNIKLVNKLLKQKTNINSNIMGKTILMHAIDAQDISMIKFLLTQPNIYINEQTFNYAIQSNNMEIINILSRSNKLEESTKNIALIAMMKLGQATAVTLLLKKITDINCTINGKSILMHAIDTNNVQMVNLLLQQPNLVVYEQILLYAKQQSGINDAIIKNISTKMHQQNLKAAFADLNPELFNKLLASIPNHINKQKYLQMIQNKLELIPDSNDAIQQVKIAEIKQIISEFQAKLNPPPRSIRVIPVARTMQSTTVSRPNSNRRQRPS